MNYDIKFRLETFRQEQPSLFDENNERYTSTPIGKETAELMLLLINDMESELKKVSNEVDTKALNLQRVRLSLLDLDKIKQQAKAHANQYKTQASSEGLENIADDFRSGAGWVLEFLRNEA